jgi:hypothetical protein
MFKAILGFRATPTSGTPSSPQPPRLKDVLASSQKGRQGQGVAAAVEDSPWITTVDFTAQVCRSILVLQETEVVFSGCVPGGMYYRDFTLQNLSDIPLHFSMSLSPGTMAAVSSKVLEFSFFDLEGEGQSGDTGKRGYVPAVGRMRVRVSFKPSAVGEYNFEAVFVNKNDEENFDGVSAHHAGPKSQTLNPQQE